METLFVVFVVIGIVVAAGVGYWIAQQKWRSEVEGAALGCFLGPIGWIIEAVLPTGDEVASHSRPTGGQLQSYSIASREAAGIPDRLTTPWSSSSDSKRASGEPDGRPPAWLSFHGQTAQEAIDAMAAHEVEEYESNGNRVVEAAWSHRSPPTVQAAFGDPNKKYTLAFPMKPRVVWESKVIEEQASAPLDVAMNAEPSSVVRPTKDCPDCAETILADARICRFCRHEFWAADAPPPEPSSDVPEESGAIATSQSDASSAPDEITETDSGVPVAESDPSPEPEPTESQAATLEPEPPPPQPGPPAPEPPPAVPEPEGRPWEQEPRPPAPPPPTPRTPPPTTPYAPPPPTPSWQPPPQDRSPQQALPRQGPSPWVPPPPPGPPDRQG